MYNSNFLKTFLELIVFFGVLVKQHYLLKPLYIYRSKNTQFYLKETSKIPRNTPQYFTTHPHLRDQRCHYSTTSGKSPVMIQWSYTLENYCKFHLKHCKQIKWSICMVQHLNLLRYERESKPCWYHILITYWCCCS